MARYAHLVGSIGLDTVDEVFSAVGQIIGPHVKRCPDGEPGGRRVWIVWQYPLLRANTHLQLDEKSPAHREIGVSLLRVADGAKPEDIHFGELGYAREARASYQDFLSARNRGALPRDVRFQVCLPTPYAVVRPFISPDSLAAVEPAYEKAMVREVETLCAAIPHQDLAIQWDICIEMLAWDGGWTGMPPAAGLEKEFAERFARLGQMIPADVEMGFHLCYGDLDGKHMVEPQDTSKAVSLANLLVASVKHPVSWVHLPVPVGRYDDAYFAPLSQLRLGPDTDLFLGLVHLDGVTGTKRRMAAAGKIVKEFGIATECGFARGKTTEQVRELLRIHAGALTAAATASDD
ncbi:MAG: hypothetical protein WB559_08195 [Candidatus Acidiferrales bacterium]